MVYDANFDRIEDELLKLLNMTIINVSHVLNDERIKRYDQVLDADTMWRR